MANAYNLPPDVAYQVLDTLLQLVRENDPKTIWSVVAGLEECPDGAIHVFLPGLLAIARS